MIRWLLVLSVPLWFLIPCHQAISLSKANPNEEKNVVYTITGVRTKHVKNTWSAWNFWRVFYTFFRNLIRSFGHETGLRNSGTFLQKRLPPYISFPCIRYGQRSPTVPDNVHQLRPGDIDVIAAMGDSMTAGTGANAVNALDAGVENRGLSFSIGGQGTFRTHLTLPNILKEFNPQLIGFSSRDGTHSEASSELNLAENIATTSDMPNMAYKLFRRIRLDRRIDMKNHWKLITITIGGNDFCQEICHIRDAPLRMNKEQEENIIRTLRFIRDTMPRTFVNLVAEPMVSLIVSMDTLRLPLPCRIGRALFCTCLEGLRFSQSRDLYLAMEQNYKEIIQRVVHRAEFQRDDFTVVYQPFGMNATVLIDNLIPDISIMAYDCVHFSQKGHAVAANALWNNMMQSESRKMMGFRPLLDEFVCPNDNNPYLNTYFNSLHEAPIRTW